MAAIARGYGARIIKNVGDSLIYYFPETADVTKWSGFKSVLESATTMISGSQDNQCKTFRGKASFS